MKPKAGTFAKISAPILPDVLPRKRLFRLLDRLCTHPVVWIMGPPGSGKTTLVTSYLASRRLRGIWYQVDAGDADLATFFHYMGLAARAAAPRHRRPLPFLAPEHLPGLPVFSRRYFEALCMRLPRPFNLVFDNYQEVPADSPFHQVMAEGLTQIPDGGRVILISRGHIPPSLAGLQANDQLAILDWEALRFTEPETRELIALKKQGKVSNEEARFLQAKTRGWVAGIILMLEWIRAEGRGLEALKKEASEAVFNYFSVEIFSKLHRYMQEGLIQTAFLPRVTLPMAERLTGTRTVGAVLSELGRSHFFVYERSGPERVYEFHDLFREFLLSRARSTWTPAELSRAQHRAAKVLEEAGYPEDAVDLYGKAEDWTAMVRIILQKAPTLVVQGRHQTLEGWLSRLPAEERDQHPWLLYWMGLCTMRNPVEARRLFETAFRLLEEEDNVMGLWQVLSAIVDTYFFGWDIYIPLDRWIGVMEKLMARHPKFPSPELETQVVTSMSYALLLRQPQHPALAVWAERGEALLQRPGEINLRIRLASRLLIYYWSLGDLGKIQWVINTVRPEISPEEISPVALIWWKALEGFFGGYVSNSLESCVQAITEGLEIARRTGVHLLDAELYSQGVCVCLCIGNLKTAGEYLEKTVPLLRKGGRLSYGHYHYLSACYTLHQGNMDLAVEHAQTGLATTLEAGAPYLEALNRLVLAQALYGCGDKIQAAEHLTRAKAIAEGMKSKALRYTCLVLEAKMALETGQENASLLMLGEALALGKAEGFLHFHWLQPTVIAMLCVKALEAGIEVEYVQDLIRKRKLVLEHPQVEMENWPWKVKLYTLGRFSILLDDRPLEIRRRDRYGKPLSLLKALIAFGGREVSQTAITEALWPEAEGDAARRAFDTTLHRLRALLGEKALILEEGKLTLDCRCGWVDLWALERMMGHLDQALKNPNPDSGFICDLAEKVFALYAGPFLREESDAPWSLNRRERLHARVLSLLENLGQCWERIEDWEHAVTCYQKSLAVDPLMEAFYQRLMVSYQRLGRRAEALCVYRRCRETLLTHLKIPPSPATEAIHRQIRAGH